MDFCISDNHFDIDLVNRKNVKKVDNKPGLARLTFVDFEVFKSFLKSNEYNDPSLQPGGQLYILMESSDTNIDNCSKKRF